MKRILFLILILIDATASAQGYSMVFHVESRQDTVMYVGQHFKDQFVIMDTARMQNGTYTFSGKRKWDKGIYALIDQTKRHSVCDFVIEGSANLELAISDKNEVKVSKGSKELKEMYAYIHRITRARNRAKELNQKLATSDSLKARKELDALNKEMSQYEDQTLKKNGGQYFFYLQNMFKGPNVPDEVDDKTYYYCQHYWDGVDLSDHSLTYTPDLFNKMNLYFFGLLYSADKDTICKYADLLLHKIEHDSTMMHYVMEYIMPKYYRSTRNIGWDATWCYLARSYYLTGKCPWSSEGDRYNKRSTCEFLEKSLIGAKGAELWMADTNQSSNPREWISSHRQPYPYVILWFWDPDCNHCQEQTASLQHLYDSLSVAGTRNFEVYAVGYESDVEKWKRYVRTHNLPWINVGGPNVNVDYQEAYNVHGAPTMIILNQRREIIMNKTLPTEAILPFIKRYEEQQKH